MHNDFSKVNEQKIETVISFNENYIVDFCTAVNYVLQRS